MNLIEISEQLKDVPDQYLVSEVQNPTGAYPAYLVVSELTRRKRMREGALKEKPETTVTEDLVGIAAAPEAADSTLGSAKQMMAQAPQMAPQMPAQLAGQMPQMPQMMAGGGLVAFEKGGPIRAFDGMFTGDYTQTDEPTMRGLIPSIKDYFTGGIYNEMRELEKAGLTDAQISQMTPEQRTQKVKEIRQAVVPAPELRTGAGTGAAPGAGTGNKTGAGTGTAPGAAPTGIRAAAPQLPIDLQALFSSQTYPTESETQATRKRAMSEFDERFPFRQKEILEKRIAERTAELQQDKKMNFNDALLAAGAAVLSAPGGGTKWMGEGLKAFNQTMIEGKKDIRKAQQLLEQSEMDLMQAESLRDQGKFAAADRAEDKAIDKADRAIKLQNTQAALGLQAFKAQTDALESQSKSRYFDAHGRLLEQGGAGAMTAAAKAGAQQPSFMDIQMAKITAAQEYKDKKIKATPEQIQELANSILKNQFPGYTPLPPVTPQVRSVEGSGATLPQ